MNKINIACIIDDDPAFTFLTKEIMEMTDFCINLLVYKNGQEAISGLTEIIKSEGILPDVILLDLNMPVMNGWEFLDEFADTLNERDVTIFIVSSSVNPTDHEKANNYQSVTDYIEKPVTEESLLEITKRVS